MRIVEQMLYPTDRPTNQRTQPVIEVCTHICEFPLSHEKSEESERANERSERPSGPLKTRLSLNRNAPLRVLQIDGFGCSRKIGRRQVRRHRKSPVLRA